VERQTGCKDRQAAEQLLAQWEREADRIRAGVLTPTEERMIGQQTLPIEDHIGAYEEHLRAKGATAPHIADTGRYLRRLTADCGFATLAGLKRDALETWLAAQAGNSMSARTRNAYRNAAVAFGNWCADPQVARLSANPFARAPKANEKADPRRQRRALTQSELQKLLAVARERPLADVMTVHRGKRKGEAYANLRNETRRRLDLLGRERALIYKTLVLTGLRKAELASLTVGQLNLDAGAGFALLHAADEKNREGNAIPLRDDLAADLGAWLEDKLTRLQEDSREHGKPIPVKLAPGTPLFDVPAGLVKILDRDLVRAGIARRVKSEDGKVRIDKRDERGRTIDVHALRTTFGTLLSKAGVTPRTAQAAMRHADIRLTMGVYTDPKLLDIRGAMDELPALPLDGLAEESQRATGTTGRASGEFARQFAAPQCKLGQTLTTEDKNSLIGRMMSDSRESNATSIPVKGKGPLTIAVSGPFLSGRLDSNQRPPEPHSGALAKLRHAPSHTPGNIAIGGRGFHPNPHDEIGKSHQAKRGIRWCRTGSEEAFVAEKRLILVGGGVRSGKSAFALALARPLGRRRLFVATAEARDDEMRLRIRRHRDERGPDFDTVEEPLELDRVIRQASEHDVVLIDCLTLWLSNRLLAASQPGEVLAHVDELLAALSERNTHVIVVTNEVGLGIVPESELGRQFRDLAGTAHQRLSRAADEVYFAVLGMMLRLKPNLACVDPAEVRS
jgi:adenosyl cobinamide kinase/adenosyl cobinamide phosphate guanylyltransferase/integrase